MSIENGENGYLPEAVEEAGKQDLEELEVTQEVEEIKKDERVNRLSILNRDLQKLKEKHRLELEEILIEENEIFYQLKSEGRAIILDASLYDDYNLEEKDLKRLGIDNYKFSRHSGHFDGENLEERIKEALDKKGFRLFKIEDGVVDESWGEKKYYIK